MYKARDTRLDRTVAVKVLPDNFSNDPVLRERFDREARTISQLDHAHICRVYDVGRETLSTGSGPAVDYLVMEYLDGQTLADRIAKGPLPLSETLTIASQIASALDKAHTSGVVHRDLKPGNIMLTKSGAKLLDFGLAKTAPPMATRAGLTMMPTAAAPLTAHGTILGTFQYMAPEQLEGHEADPRSDIFAFGAVLYETLTARKPFEGKSHASLISSIMSADPPPIATLIPLAPPVLDYIVRTCLAKDPAERWQNAHDLVRQLDWVAHSSAAAAPPVARRANTRQRLIGSAAAVLALGILAIVVLQAGRWLGARGELMDASTVRLALVPPENTFVPNFELSPDGRRLAFMGVTLDGKRAIWIRSLDALDAQSLKGTETGGRPFWSPDGRYIGFFAQGKLKKIEVAGGSPQTICDAPGAAGGTWGRDGTIVFRPTWGHALQRVSADGGMPVPATTIDASKEAAHLHPHFLPDGRRFLYFVRSAQRETQGVYAATLDSTRGTRLFGADSGAVYVGSRHVLFVREGALIERAFDAGALKVDAAEVTVAARVQFDESDNFAQFTASPNGRLVYRIAAPFRSQLLWVDATGKEIGRAPADAERFALSPDEKRVALTRQDSQTAADEVWLIDLSRGIASKFSASPTSDVSTIWSPDSARIVFASDQGAAGYYNLFEKPSIGGSNNRCSNPTPTRFPATGPLTVGSSCTRTPRKRPGRTCGCCR